MTKTTNIPKDAALSIPKGDPLSLPKGYKNSPLGIIPEDWEVKKLGKFGDFLKGKGVPKDKITDNGYKCLTYGDIYTKYDNIIKDCRSFIDEEIAKISQELIKGDLLFAGSGETLEDIGKCVTYIDEDKAFAGGDIIIFRPTEKVDSYTLAHILNSSKSNSQKHKMGQGHSVVHIYASLLQFLKIALPPLPEQQKIAEILSTWDAAIEKQNQLIQQLELRKRGLMQQLLTGKLRLRSASGERFEGEWKKVKLGELFKLLKGNGLSKDKVGSKGKYPCILYGELYTTYDEIISEIRSYTDVEEGTKSKKGDILVPSSTTTNGLDLITSSCITFDNVLLGGDIIILRPFGNINPEFFSLLFSNALKRKFVKYTQGVTIIHIYGNDFIKEKIHIPSLPEQTSIAEVLSSADNQIELEKQKLNALRNQKKGLMQVLLSGRKRVKIKK